MPSEYLNNKKFEAIIESFQDLTRLKKCYELKITDLQQTHSRRQQKYGDDLRLSVLQECRENYKKLCLDYSKCQEELAFAFYILSENIANYTHFSGIETEDAVQDGVCICFEKIDRFDTRKGKAFAFFTTVQLNMMRQTYRSIRNYNELKRKYGMHLQSKLRDTFMKGKHAKYKDFFDLDNISNLP